MRGETISLDPNMLVTCISSGGVVLGETPIHPASDENDMSVSLLIQFGDFRYFVGGDIEVHTEEKIATHDLVMAVDVYQANHHGSHTGSAVNFLNDMLPNLVVISNGNTIKYKHPRQVTLTNLAILESSSNRAANEQVSTRRRRRERQRRIHRRSRALRSRRRHRSDRRR